MHTGYFSVTFYLNSNKTDGAVIICAANAVEVRAWFAAYMPTAEITDMQPCQATF